MSKVVDILYKMQLILPRMILLSLYNCGQIIIKLYIENSIIIDLTLFGRKLTYYGTSDNSRRCSDIDIWNGMKEPKFQSHLLIKKLELCHETITDLDTSVAYLFEMFLTCHDYCSMTLAYDSKAIAVKEMNTSSTTHIRNDQVSSVMHLLHVNIKTIIMNW